MAVHHETYPLDGLRGPPAGAADVGRIAHVLHVPVRGPDHGRIPALQSDRRRATESHGWPLRNYMWATAGPAFCAQVEEDVPTPDVRYKIIDGFCAVWRFKLENLVNSDNTVAERPDHPLSAGRRRQPVHVQLWAYSGRELRDACCRSFSQFCRKYYDDRRDIARTCCTWDIAMLKDQQSLLSYSWDGNVMTIDPVSTANPGWQTVPAGVQRVLQRSRRRSAVQPDAALTRAQVEKALGDRWQQFGGCAARVRPGQPAAERIFPRFAGRG